MADRTVTDSSTDGESPAATTTHSHPVDDVAAPARGDYDEKESSLGREPSTASYHNSASNAASTTHLRSTRDRATPTTDDPNGLEACSDGDPTDRNLSPFQTIGMLMKTTIGLGVMIIPYTFYVLGIIPGVLAVVAIALLMNWAGQQVHPFMKRHPEVEGIEDAARHFAGDRIGPILVWFFGIAYCLFWIFVAGSFQKSIWIALSAASGVEVGNAAIVGYAGWVFILASFRRLNKISILAWFGIFCILTAVITEMISLAIHGRPTLAPQIGDWLSDFQLFGNPSFAEIARSLAVIAFAYSGVPAYFHIHSKMKEPEKFPTCLWISQSIVTVVYLTVAVVISRLAGSYVTAPALGSAGETVTKVVWIWALPGLIVTATIVTHLPADTIHRYSLPIATKMMDRKSDKTEEKKKKRSETVDAVLWFGCNLLVTVISCCLALVPKFDNLVSFTGAIFTPLLTILPAVLIWRKEHWAEVKKYESFRICAMVIFCVLVSLFGLFLMVSGGYGSIEGMIKTDKA